MYSKIIVCDDSDLLKEKIEHILKKQKILSPGPDLLSLDQEKLGVNETKLVRQFLSIKPFSSKGRGVVILNAQNLTQDAQNSLLKTLEEPPLESIIILGVDNAQNLSPTILSRCEVIGVKGQVSSIIGEGKYLKEVGQLEDMDIDQRFTVVEKAEDKELLLKEMLQFYRSKLQQDSKYLEFTKQLLEAERWANQNVNLRAILEYLMLSLP